MRLRLALLCALASCGPRFERVDHGGAGPTEVRAVKLSWSNAFLIRDGDAWALVDAGSPADLETLFVALANQGLREHLYQDDPVANRANIGALLDRGVERFYLGHGGPVTRAAVTAWLRP